MLEAIKISIITPNYNNCKFLTGLFQSVQSQTYQNFEHIIIDGGSTDGSCEVILAYQKKYTNIIYLSEKDDGMYDAINKGLNMATGEIICYLNTDDRFFNWTLHEVVKSAQVFGLDRIYYGDLMQVFHNCVEPYYYIRIFPKVSIDYLLKGNTLGQPTVFLGKDVLNKAGYFDRSFKFLADCEYWLRSLAKYHISFVKINEVLALENNHESTLRSKYLAEVAIEKDKIISLYKNYEYVLTKFYIFSRINIKKYWFYLSLKKIILTKSWSNFLLNYKISLKLRKKNNLKITLSVDKSITKLF